MNLRKLVFTLACLTLLIAIGTAAHGADMDQSAQPLGKMQTILKSNHFGKDWGFALGLKTWANEWALPVENVSGTKAHFINQFESDTEFSYVLSGVMRYRNFFMGGSFLPEKEYDFKTQRFSNINSNPDNTITYEEREITPSGERKEWDINVGYFITPNLALSLGYKRMDRDLTNAYQDFDIKDDFIRTNIEDSPLTAEGPIIGLATSLPIGKQFSFYGNFAYGMLNGDASQKVIRGPGDWNYQFDLDGKYYFAELGFNYVIPLKKIISGIAISAGYRYQRLDYEFESASASTPEDYGEMGDQNDTTSGFVFGINFVF